MKIINLSKRAEKDLETIFDYGIENFGLLFASSYSLSIENCIDLISQNPKMGRLMHDFRSETRRFEHQQHVIFYRETTQGIYVIRVIHRRRLVNLSVFH
jgi:toxin ParE1/3/4